TGKLIRTLTGHKHAVGSLAFTPDASVLASAGGEDRMVMLWNPETGQLLRTLGGHGNIVYEIAFAPDGKRLASASGERVGRLWDVAAGELVAAFSGGGLCVAWAPDGKSLASGGANGVIRVWDLPPAAEER